MTVQIQVSGGWHVDIIRYMPGDLLLVVAINFAAGKKVELQSEEIGTHMQALQALWHFSCAIAPVTPGISKSSKKTGILGAVFVLTVIWGIAGMGICSGMWAGGLSGASGLLGVFSSSIPPKLKSSSLVIGLSWPAVTYFACKVSPKTCRRSELTFWDEATGGFFELRAWAPTASCAGTGDDAIGCVGLWEECWGMSRELGREKG